MTKQSYDQLEVRVFENRDALGLEAAEFAARQIAEAVAIRGEARVVFACAPSQNEFLAALADPCRQGTPVDWTKVIAFHMDEYIGLTAGADESFRHYLHSHLLEWAPSRPVFHEIRGEAASPQSECVRYARLVAEKPIDLVCLGIGENGHLAFNDPPVADFRDPEVIKVVELDAACRQQQVNDGCFPALNFVPTHALTLTVPALFGARHICAVVPGPRKAAAVRSTLTGAVSPDCPASILRTHPHAVLLLDRDSAALLAHE